MVDFCIGGLGMRFHNHLLNIEMAKADLVICQTNLKLIIKSDDQRTSNHIKILIKTGDFYSYQIRDKHWLFTF